MQNIYLIGFMGSGKSTLGDALANRLGCQFIDLDRYIESRYVDSISNLFKRSGEAGFRNLETKLLQEVLEFENVVIAMGGGTPIYDDNLQKMLSKGKVIYLNCDVDLLKKRLVKEIEGRPLLHGLSQEESDAKINTLLAHRTPIYENAHLMIDTGLMNIEQLVDLLIKRLDKEKE